MAEKNTIPKWLWKVIAVALVAVIVFLLIKSCNAKRSASPPVGNDSTVYWKNEYGKEFASRKASEEQFSIFNEEYLDSIARLLDSKSKLLREVAILKQKGKVTLTNPGAPTILFKEKTDTITGECLTIERVEQDFSNPYYKAHAVIPLNGDSSSLQLETYDTLVYVVRVVKEGGLFNRRSFLQIDASNANPDNKITGMNVYRKALPKPKKFAIGFQLGGRVTITKTFVPTIKPYAGVGGSWNFIRL